MKPIIGIIYRNSLSETNKKINIIYEDINKCIINSGGIPIGISNKYIDNYFNICDGFILQGGNDIEPINLEIINKIREKNIPLLGICLGMQEIGICYNGVDIDIDIDNHLHTYHDIIIDKYSLLYKIVNSDKIKVNSRHKSSIINSNLYVSSKSLDNINESFEDRDKLFLLGLQWHPENMYDNDVNSRKIFDYFIKICNDN